MVPNLEPGFICAPRYDWAEIQALALSCLVMLGLGHSYSVRLLMKPAWFALFSLAALSACSNDAAPAKPLHTEPGPTLVAPLQCGKDTDCKGDRICETGVCVAPPGPASAAPAPNHTTGLSAPSALAVAATNPPVCRAGDERIPVPVWTPVNQGEDDWTPAPPQHNEQIVYIDAAQVSRGNGCTAEGLNTLSFPEDEQDVMAGGLAVNLRGNAQVVDGICHYRGFFRNEDVPGVHQGWVETYFEAVPSETVLPTGRYCLERALP